MEEKQSKKRWSFLTDRQIWCNVLILGIGFAGMAVYTNVAINKQRNANVAGGAVRARGNRNWIERATGPEFLGAHLTAVRDDSLRGNFQSPQRGYYFRWTSSGSNCFSSLEVNHEPEGTMVYIHKPGFYFVYSQVRYNGYGLYPAGHKTMKIAHNIETTLMTSITTQQLASAGTRHNFATKTTDSGYHAGIFYFAAGDKLAVKPLLYERTYTAGDDASFFGLYFLHN